MTLQKPRDPSNLSGVVAEHIKILTAKTCAAITGRAASVIYKFADEDSGLVLHDVRALIQLDRACHESANRTPFRDWLDKQLQGNCSADVDSPEQEALQATAAHGSVMLTLSMARTSHSPGGKSITETERREIALQIRQAQAQHDDIVRAIAQEVGYADPHRQLRGQSNAM